MQCFDRVNIVILLATMCLSYSDSEIIHTTLYGHLIIVRKYNFGLI